jgi:hypothetical protein
MRCWRLKRWSRVVAFVLLLASVRPVHTASDDEACSPWPEALSTESGTAFLAGENGPSGVGHQEHCAVCHWTRLLRSPLTQTGVTIAGAAATSPLEGTGPGSYVGPTHDHLPARAPPAFLG